MKAKTKTINNINIISFTLLLCLTMIFFQAVQQMYYFSVYEIGNPNITFFEAVFRQFRKWTLWFIYAFILWLFIKKLAKKNQLSTADIGITLAVICVLLVMVIATLCLFEYMTGGNGMVSDHSFGNHFIYLVFQKFPIYFFGFIFLAMVMYLYNINNHLVIQVLKLDQLNKKDLTQYYQKNSNRDSESSVLKIKVGNSYKIISVDEIDWIEADDYCVNIHCKNNEAIYSMRSTLKALESSVPENFLRVHRSAIVNMNHVQEFQTKGTGLVKLNSGDEVTVSKSKLKTINEFYHAGH